MPASLGLGRICFQPSTYNSSTMEGGEEEELSVLGDVYRLQAKRPGRRLDRRGGGLSRK